MREEVGRYVWIHADFDDVHNGRHVAVGGIPYARGRCCWSFTWLFGGGVCWLGRVEGSTCTSVVHATIDMSNHSEAVLPYLDEEDFEQMRIDTRQLLAENERLRERIAYLEHQIVTYGWAGWKLH